MKTVFFGILILIMLLSIYGYKISAFKDLKQDVLSAVKRENYANTVEDKNILQTVPKSHSETEQLQHALGDPDIEKALKEMREEEVIIMNPIMQRLLEMEESDLDVKRYFLLLLFKIKGLKGLMVKLFFITASLIPLLMLIVRKTTFSGTCLLFAKFSFSLSRIFVFIAALIAVTAWFSFKYNFYMAMGSIFLLVE